MARGPSKRVVLNRAALDQVTLGLADGLAGLTKAIIAEADTPDAPPYGEGLVDKGDWGVWVNGRKVSGSAAKPRAARLQKPGITALVGYGFPARFVRDGTVDTPAHGWFDQSIASHIQGAEGYLKPAMRARMGARP